MPKAYHRPLLICRHAAAALLTLARLARIGAVLLQSDPIFPCLAARFTSTIEARPGAR
jgi:hypothetical protein